VTGTVNPIQRFDASWKVDWEAVYLHTSTTLIVGLAFAGSIEIDVRKPDDPLSHKRGW